MLVLGDFDFASAELPSRFSVHFFPLPLPFSILFSLSGSLLIELSPGARPWSTQFERENVRWDRGKKRNIGPTPCRPNHPWHSAPLHPSAPSSLPLLPPQSFLHLPTLRTSTYEPKCDLSINTVSGCHRFSFEEKFKILGHSEERMQSVNKAIWKDTLTHRSKDIPRKIKCQRLVDHVFAVFSFGSENWSWTTQTFERMGDKAYASSFPVQKTKRSNMGRLLCNNLQRIQMGLLFLYEISAEACGVPWDGAAMKSPMP